jgi:ABC-type branched-subunit amino acid transport system substrate-binding protein
MKRITRISTGLFAILCGVLMLTAAAGPAASSQSASQAQFKGTLQVGAILPFTGDGAAYGPGMRTAMNIAASEINKAGGVLGKKLVINYEDDATNPDQGVRAAHKLIDIKHVKGILGTWASSVTLAVAPLTIKANIIEMNVSGSPTLSTLQPAGKRTVYRVNATDAALGDAVAKYLYKRYKTATILANNAAGTAGFGQVFNTSFRKYGGKILAYINYPDKQADYTAQVQQAVRTKPAVYLLSCYSPDGTVILKQAYQLGATAKFAMPLWCLNDQLIQATGAQAVNGDISFDLVAQTRAPAYKRLNAAFKKQSGDTVFNNPYAAHVYDGVNLFALAVAKAKTTNARVIGKVLRAISGPRGKVVTSYAQGLRLLKSRKAINYDGASGPINFDAHGDMAPFVGFFTVKNGKITLTSTFAP